MVDFHRMMISITHRILSTWDSLIDFKTICF